MAERLTVKGRILAVVIGLVLTAGLVEGILRLIGFGYPAWEVRDAEVGIIGTPSAAGWWTREGRGYVRFNADGLRDANRSMAKPAGVWRILVVGDSMVQGREVNADETFVAGLETRLNRCSRFADRRVEVFNFGFGAYNTAAEIQLLRTRGWKYQPDEVLLALYVGNDINGNSAKLHPRFAGGQDYGIPYLRFDGGLLALDMSFRDRPGFRAKLESPVHRILKDLVNRSAALQLLYYGRVQFQARWLGARQAADVDDDNGRLGGVHWPVLEPPRNADWEEAWRLTEAGVVLMRDEVEAQGARFRMVTIAMPDQVFLPREAKVPDYPQRRLEAFAARAGIGIITLLEPFREDFLGTGTYSHGFEPASWGRGHLNRDGHRVAAEVIASRLCAEGASSVTQGSGGG